MAGGSFDVDLGELMPGHGVIPHGIEQGRTFEPPTAGPVRVEEADRLHYEHVPGLDPESPMPDWRLIVSDDLGTEYLTDDSGAYDGYSGGPATHGPKEPRKHSSRGFSTCPRSTSCDLLDTIHTLAAEINYRSFTGSSY